MRTLRVGSERVDISVTQRVVQPSQGYVDVDPRIASVHVGSRAITVLLDLFETTTSADKQVDERLELVTFVVDSQHGPCCLLPSVAFAERYRLIGSVRNWRMSFPCVPPVRLLLGAAESSVATGRGPYGSSVPARNQRPRG
jgi:hypothetical protein